MMALKSVWQRYNPSDEVVAMLRSFRDMVNLTIRVGIDNDVTSLHRLSSLTYRQLKRYDIPSYYRLCAMSRAAGILDAMRKSVKRGRTTKYPYASKFTLTSCYGFSIHDGNLWVPLGRRRFLALPLTQHVLNEISCPVISVRSFTITLDKLILCIRKEVLLGPCQAAAGVDINLRNVTYGGEGKAIRYDLSETVKIAQTTKEITSSFRRDDDRIRKKVAKKYGRRRRDRIASILHVTSKMIVKEAKSARKAIVLEDIRGIRAMYSRGNGQGKKYRGMMNSWPFGEVKRQVEYKAAWEGVPVILLSKGETRNTSTECPRCGERLQSAYRGDTRHIRKLWCPECKSWKDRDVVAVMNQSRRGWVRFAQSLPYDTRAKGVGGEAMNGNPMTTVILRVDPSKLSPSRLCRT